MRKVRRELPLVRIVLNRSGPGDAAVRKGVEGYDRSRDEDGVESGEMSYDWQSTDDIIADVVNRSDEKGKREDRSLCEHGFHRIAHRTLPDARFTSRGASVRTSSPLLGAS